VWLENFDLVFRVWLELMEGQKKGGNGQEGKKGGRKKITNGGLREFRCVGSPNNHLKKDNESWAKPLKGNKSAEKKKNTGKVRGPLQKAAKIRVR